MIKRRFLLIIVVLLFGSCSSYKWTEKATERLFGKSIYLKKTYAKYSSEGVFDININGDGYDIDVFILPEEYVNYIIDNFEKIKSEYPKYENGLYPYKRKESIHWKETPMDENEKIIHDEIIGNENCYFYKSKLFQKAIKYYKESIIMEGNYYSYICKINEHSRDIDFYVFNPKKRILIIIYYHT
jgi:hypothetical protein